MLSIDKVAHLNRWRSRSVTEKATLALGMMIITISLPSLPVALMVMGVMTGAAILGARVPAKLWLACTMGTLGFLLTGSLSLMLHVDVGGIRLMPEEWPTVVRLTLQALAGFTCLQFLALTTPTTDLLSGLRRLGIPSEILEVALLIYRFLFLLVETAAAMHAAQAARLGHNGMRRRIQSLGSLVANLLARALDRAQRLETGLAARGWNGAITVVRRSTPVSVSGLSLILMTEAVTAALGLWYR
ncbi:MAG: cobalt ECF transporter T component CbiQ [Magnetococcales bacterium]|nr:cobalt ECF transporter T component CbiQ [Magnetococcales bacterium]